MRYSLVLIAALLALTGAVVASALRAPREPAPVPAAVAPVAAPAPAVAEAEPAPRAPELQSVVVGARPVHTVPDDAATQQAPKVTLMQRDGRVIEGGTPPSAPPRASQTALATALATTRVSGKGQAAGGTSVSVAGRGLGLFGVRPPDPRERCAQPGGGAVPCADAARAALATRLAGSPSVSCVAPPGQGGEPRFICHDAAGTDLGGFLVGEGLATVDRASSFQYVAAEDRARAAKSGLWRYR